MFIIIYKIGRSPAKSGNLEALSIGVGVVERVLEDWMGGEEGWCSRVASDHE